MAGDRPIEITLQRAWAALSWQQRWRLGRLALAACARPVEAPDARALEAMQEDDVIASVLSQVSDAFPEVRTSSARGVALSSCRMSGGAERAASHCCC